MASTLALQNESRGPDSFGWAVWVAETDEPSIYKSIGKIGELARFSGVLPPQAMMHTRRATTGAITKDNAHPWQIGDILGAHNGMIFDHDSLNTKFNRTYKVDSQHLIAHIAENRSLEELHGWGAVEYVHKENPRKIHLGHTATSTLAVASLRYKNGQGTDLGVFWSSESDHLRRALSLGGYYYRMLHVKPNRLYAVEGNLLLKVGKFKLGSYCSPGTTQGWDSRVWDDEHPVGGYEGYNQWTHRRGEDSYTPNKGRQLTLLPPMVQPPDPAIKPAISNFESSLLTDQAQCDSCLLWMEVAETSPGISKVVVPDKVFYLYEIDKWLCGKCFLIWLNKGDIDKRYYEGALSPKDRGQTP